MFVVACLLFAVCCWRFVVRCLLFLGLVLVVGRCSLLAVRSSFLVVVRCSLLSWGRCFFFEWGCGDGREACIFYFKTLCLNRALKDTTVYPGTAQCWTLPLKCKIMKACATYINMKLHIYLVSIVLLLMHWKLESYITSASK